MKTAALIFCIVIGLAPVARAAGQAAQTSAPSASEIGVCSANEKAPLRSAFVNAVNRYLRRYDPRLETRQDNYVKMSATYDYLFNIELFIRDKEYEIVVTVAQSKYSENRAQKIAVKIANNIQKATENYMIRGARVRDRVDDE